jgi:hypothetical protein
MPYPIDPASLDGEELDRWYRRTPQEVEAERQAAEGQSYGAFFNAPEPTTYEDDDESPPVASSAGIPSNNSDVLWIANGKGGYRAIRPGTPDYEATLAPAPVAPDALSGNPAAPEIPNLIDVGNPHNRRLRRESEAASGQPWPKTEDGRNYHVAHKRAIADGGTNTLDNIEPMHPDAHMAQHAANGDNARWGRRPWTARAFGGRVEPPTPRGRVNGFGLFGIVPDITAIFSGRIRTDTPTHFWYDLTGYPAPDDYPPPVA